MHPRRAPLIGALAGLVLLVGMVGFAVGLPEVSGAPDDDLAEALPEELPAVGDAPALTALDTRTESAAEGSGEAGSAADQTREAQEGVADSMSEALDAPVAVRAYSDETGQQQVTVVVVDAAGGAVVPDQLPVPEDYLVPGQPRTEMTRDGDVVCTAFFAPTAGTDPALPTDPADPGAEEAAETPTGVSCTLATRDRSWAIKANGLTAPDASELLRTLAEE